MKNFKNVMILVTSSVLSEKNERIFALPSKASLSANAGWHCPLAKNPCRNNIFFINFPNKQCKISHKSAIIANFARIFKCFL